MLPRQAGKQNDAFVAVVLDSAFWCQVLSQDISKIGGLSLHYAMQQITKEVSTDLCQEVIPSLCW